MRDFEKTRKSVLRRCSIRHIIILFLFLCVLLSSDDIKTENSSAYIEADIYTDASGYICGNIQKGRENSVFRIRLDAVGNVYRYAFRFWKEVLPFYEK